MCEKLNKQQENNNNNNQHKMPIIKRFFSHFEEYFQLLLVSSNEQNVCHFVAVLSSFRRLPTLFTNVRICFVLAFTIFANKFIS